MNKLMTDLRDSDPDLCEALLREGYSPRSAEELIAVGQNRVRRGELLLQLARRMTESAA